MRQIERIVRPTRVPPLSRIATLDILRFRSYLPPMAWDVSWLVSNSSVENKEPKCNRCVSDFSKIRTNHDINAVEVLLCKNRIV